MNKLCESCPLWLILCGPFLPETDVQKANQRAIKAEEEVHTLKGIMAGRGIDAGGSIYIKGQKEG